ncbi:MAG: decarboxylating 6-phosphogluconate dehydrogenase [Halobacteriales archaeon]|nr:decarboxylating 6-phosphogluconate dehydrogenase [Halobacteriales archaeon]
MTDEVGIVGLGKMGGNVAQNLVGQGYDTVGYDVDAEARQEAEGETAESIDALADALEPPRVVWISVPHGEPVDETLDALADALENGDIVVDAGNSDYRKTRERAVKLEQKGVALLDAGCSGGPSGALEGLSIMVGGDREAYESIEPLFDDLSVEGGYEHFGPAGAGHYVKMVHNGVEYAMMQAIGEGFELLAEGEYDEIDLEDVARVWSNGSVVESHLIRLTRRAFARNPRLEGVKGHVPDSGEGRWTVETAIENDVPATGIAHSLFARYRSRVGDEGTFADKVLAVLRHEFGGHDVEKDEG